MLEKNKHYSRHREHSVKLCTIGSKTFCPPLVGVKTTNESQSNIIDPPNEYIISKLSGAECQQELVSITPRAAIGN